MSRAARGNTSSGVRGSVVRCFSALRMLDAMYDWKRQALQRQTGAHGRASEAKLRLSCCELRVREAALPMPTHQGCEAVPEHVPRWQWQRWCRHIGRRCGA